MVEPVCEVVLSPVVPALSVATQLKVEPPIFATKACPIATLEQRVTPLELVTVGRGLTVTTNE